MEVQLDSAEVLSLSFLDGFVTELLTAGDLDRVIFLASSQRVQEKLSQVAALHPEVTIRFRAAYGAQPARVTPASVKSDEPTFERSKASTSK